MKTRRQYHPVFAPVEGLRYDLTSTMLPERATPNCEGIEFLDDRMRKMLGTVEFAGTVGSALNGKVMALNRIASILMCHTTTKVYQLVSSTFSDKTDSAFTGDEDNFISHAYIPDSAGANHYVWTNFKDPIRKYALSGSVSALGGASNYRPRWLQNFGERLNLYNVTDGGAQKKTRVRWCKLGDFEDWTATGSGFVDLTAYLGDSDEIMRAEKLAAYVIIYGQSGIIRQNYTGNASTPFSFAGQVSGVGLVAPRALVNIEGGEHIFMGVDDIYSYTGGRDPVPIGTSIRDELFNIMTAEYVNRSFMVHEPEDESIRLHVPIEDSTTPNACFSYNLRSRVWTRLPYEYLGYGRHVVETALTWATITGTWEETALTWDARTLNKLQPITLYGDSSGHVYSDDDTSYNMEGSAIDAWWDTKDFTTGDGYLRTTTHWMELNFEARGHTVSVYQSTDGGTSYTLLEAVTLTRDWASYRVDLDVTSPQIRFQFRNATTDETFEVKWIEVGHLPSTDRRVA